MKCKLLNWSLVLWLLIPSLAFAQFGSIKTWDWSDSSSRGPDSVLFADTSNHAYRADSSIVDFNPLHLFGGFVRDELDVQIHTTFGTARCWIDSEHFTGTNLDIWLSNNGEGMGLAMYTVSMADSVALTAGTATTTQSNFIFYRYNSGSPDLAASTSNPAHSLTGTLVDSVVVLAEIGLGAVSGGSATVRYFDLKKPYLYKVIQRLTHANSSVSWHEGVTPSLAAGGVTLSVTAGWVRKLDDIRIPAAGTGGAHGNQLPLIVPVYNDSAYATWDSLTNFLEYSDGTTITATHRVWVVLWGAASDADTTNYKYYLNIQAGSNTYNSLAKAEEDAFRMIPLDIPAAFEDVGFLIGGFIYHKGGDTIVTLSDGTKFRDLRGAIGAGGASNGPTVVEDIPYAASWNGNIEATSKNSIYDYLVQFDAEADGVVNFADSTDAITDGGVDLNDLAANSVDSTKVVANSLSMSGDLQAFASADLAGRLTNETGSGLAVFGTDPTLSNNLYVTDSAYFGGNVVIGGTAFVDTIAGIYAFTSIVDSLLADIIRVGERLYADSSYIANEHQIPHGANPTTDTTGEIAIDTDFPGIEIRDTIADASMVLGFHQQKSFTICSPGDVNDTVTVFPVSAKAYPHGIKLLWIELRVNDSVGTYALEFEEWTGDGERTRAGYIDTITVAVNSSFNEVAGSAMTDSDIAADNQIRVLIPATAKDEITGTFIFYAKDGD